MPLFLEFADQLEVFIPGYMLVFTRLSAMLMTLPIFSYPMISGRTRVMLAFVLTVIIGSILNMETIPPVTNLWMLTGLMAKEVVIGMIIGFGGRLIFEGFSIAGGIVGLQMGMGIANVMDPTSREHIPIITQFWLPMMILFLLLMDGHHFFIETLFGNFQMIPLGMGELSPKAGESIVRGGSRIYDIGIRFAAPCLILCMKISLISPVHSSINYQGFRCRLRINTAAQKPQPRKNVNKNGKKVMLPGAWMLIQWSY